MPLQATQSSGHSVRFGRQKRQSWDSTWEEGGFSFSLPGLWTVSSAHLASTAVLYRGMWDAHARELQNRPEILTALHLCYCTGEGMSPFSPAGLYGAEEQYGDMQKPISCCERLRVSFTHCAALCSISSFPQTLSVLSVQGEWCCSTDWWLLSTQWFPGPHLFSIPFAG